MKGVIFNVLEEMVIEQAGMSCWNEILDELSMAGIYTAGQSYPDSELFALVEKISARLELPMADVVGAFGEFLFTQLAERYPVFIEQQPTLRGFLKSVDEVIHVEVRKLFESPSLPSFEYLDGDDGSLVMIYRSPRQLCLLAEGLSRGAAKHYGQAVQIHQRRCTHQGDEQCEIVVQFV